VEFSIQTRLTAIAPGNCSKESCASRPRRFAVSANFVLATAERDVCQRALAASGPVQALRGSSSLDHCPAGPEDVIGRSITKLAATSSGSSAG